MNRVLDYHSCIVGVLSLRHAICPGGGMLMLVVFDVVCCDFVEQYFLIAVAVERCRVVVVAECCDAS